LQVLDQDAYVEQQPKVVDVQLWLGMGINKRKDKLPGKIGTERQHGHAVAFIEKSPAQDEQVSQGPEQAGADLENMGYRLVDLDRVLEHCLLLGITSIRMLA
jgi:hypothetical protein